MQLVARGLAAVRTLAFLRLVLGSRVGEGREPVVALTPLRGCKGDGSSSFVIALSLAGALPCRLTRWQSLVSQGTVC